MKKCYSLIFFDYLCIRKTQSGCSAVGSALRSGRRGRAFESPHPDIMRQSNNLVVAFVYRKVIVLVIIKT